MFDKSKKAAPAKKSSSKTEAPKVHIKGTFRHTALKSAIKFLSGLADAEETKMKNGAIDHWVATGMAKKARPVNIKAIEGSAETQIDLKIRPCTSAVTPEDKERCEKLKIVLGTHSKVEGHWIINPEIEKDKTKMDAIVERLKDLDWADDLFEWQEEIVDIVTDQTLDAIFKLEDEKEVRSLLGALAVVSAKPTACDDISAFKEVNLIPEVSALMVEVSPTMEEVKDVIASVAKEVARGAKVRSREEAGVEA